jgi:ribosomal protection tetracycline resistance protein
VRVRAGGSGLRESTSASDGLDPRDAPLYAFKNFDAFVEHMDEVRPLALDEGLYGWQVTDCVVDGDEDRVQPRRRPPVAARADAHRPRHQEADPLVLMQALEQAGRRCASRSSGSPPRVPTESIGSMLAAVGRLGAGAATPSTRGELSVLESDAARVTESRSYAASSRA